MAQLNEGIISTFTTGAVNDYTAMSPNSLALGALILSSARPPLVQNRDTAEILVNSTTGAKQYSVSDLGLAAGSTFQIQHVMLDPKNDTDADVVVSFFRAAHNNDFSSTGYSGWTFTNPLDGGGKKAFKILLTQRANDGTVTHVHTLPVVCTEFTPGEDSGYETFTATLLMVGPPSVA